MPALNTTTRRSTRQDIIRYLDYGTTGTATSTGDDTRELTDTSRTESEDYWKDGQIHVTSGTREGETSRVTTSLPKGELHLHPVMGGTIASGVTYELYSPDGWDKEDYDLAIKESLIWCRERFLITYTVETTQMAASTFEHDLPQKEIIAASATGGTTTTLIDTSNLTQDDDYWNGDIVIITADSSVAANVGEVRMVKDFAASTDTITLDHALPGVVSSNTTYRLIKYTLAFVHRIMKQETTNEWVDLPGGRDAWDVVPGLYPRLLLNSGVIESGRPLRIIGQRYPGEVAVDLDLVEPPQTVIRPYVEFFLREMRARGGRSNDPADDRARAREAREEAEIALEQQSELVFSGSRRVG